MLYGALFSPDGDYGESLYAVLDLNGADFRALLRLRNKLLVLRDEESGVLSLTVTWHYPERIAEGATDHAAYENIDAGQLVPLESIDVLPEEHMAPRIGFSVAVLYESGVSFVLTEKHSGDELSSHLFDWGVIEKLADGE